MGSDGRGERNGAVQAGFGNGSSSKNSSRAETHGGREREADRARQAGTGAAKIQGGSVIGLRGGPATDAVLEVERKPESSSRFCEVGTAVRAEH
jgi:hypothetical protein